MLLEVCVDSPRGIVAAVEGGANRLELCSALALGGLSPSAGLVRLASAVEIPVFAMVRPRPGNFVFDASDEEAMLIEIDALRAAGMDGVVLGANRPDGTLDAALLSRLLERAKGMGTTLHRAFDLVPDLDDALDTAIALGFDRILTSGAQLTAWEGVDAIGSLDEKAAGRISIMPGSGITAANVADIVGGSAIREVHASCRSAETLDGSSRAVRFGFQENEQAETDQAKVAQLRAALAHLDAAGPAAE